MIFFILVAVSSQEDLYFLIKPGNIFFNTRNRFFPFRCSMFSNTFYYQGYRNRSTHTLIGKGKVYLYNRK